MRYANLLSDAVIKSGWTYEQIVNKCEDEGVKFSRSYLSKICTGHMPPASDDINKVLACVLSSSGLTYERLALAKYKEIIPKEIIKAIASGL